MNRYLPPSGSPEHFKSTPAMLKRIAWAMGAYAFFVLYPAYCFLTWIATDVAPSWQQTAIIAACAVAFGFYAHREMTKLTRGRRSR